MKKYLFGMIALVCAIAFASFTTAKKQTLQKFQYSLDTQAGVFTPGNWVEDDTPESCGFESPEIPCVVEIDLEVYPTIGDYLTVENTISKILNSDEFREAKEVE